MPESTERSRFPQRLHHHTPSWAASGACFHIRLRLAPPCALQLTDPPVARALLEAARHYHESLRWSCRLILLMPDHAHALLGFPIATDMGKVVGDWKRFTARRHRIAWQTNFFDHRIRDHHKLQEAAIYIRRNPVVKGLCKEESDWRWVWPDSWRE